MVPAHSGPDAGQNRDQLNHGRLRWKQGLSGVVSTAETDFEHGFHEKLVGRGEINDDGWPIFSIISLLLLNTLIACTYEPKHAILTITIIFGRRRNLKRPNFRHFRDIGVVSKYQANIGAPMTDSDMKTSGTRSLVNVLHFGVCILLYLALIDAT